MKRLLLGCIVAVLLVSCFAGARISASASTVTAVQPRYTGIVSVRPYLTIQALGKAQCTDRVLVKSGYSAMVTWELQSNANGTWGTLATWRNSGSGTLSLDTYRYVTKGAEYRLKTSFKAYDAADILVDDTYFCSSSVSY